MSMQGPRAGAVAALVVLAALVVRVGDAAGSRVAAGARVAPDPVAALAARVTIGYDRGRKVALRVVTIDWAEVEIATARAFLRMREAAAAAGVEIAIRNAFREPEHQAWLYQAYRAGWGNPAARPGYSNHQSGRALDLIVRDPAVMAWLDGNARRFGFRRTVRAEPWHWELDRRLAARGQRVSRRTKSITAGVTRSKPPPS